MSGFVKQSPMKRVALFGGNFNPPGAHHVAIAEALAHDFDEVIAIPGGLRPERSELEDIDPIFRATLTDLAFGHLPHLKVELFDLEQGIFTPTCRLLERFPSDGEYWIVVGEHHVRGGSSGQAPIQTSWQQGTSLWNQARFVVVHDTQNALPPEDLPPHHKLLPLALPCSSEQIRSRLLQGRLPDHWLPVAVRDYIERHRLYTGRLPIRTTELNLNPPRILIEADPSNPEAMEWASHYRAIEDEDHPDCILVIGGDGTMLRAIRKHWRRRLPFFGINAGHVGFLLNEPTADLRSAPTLPTALICRHLPMLYVEMQDMEGQWNTTLAFNDAWVERAGSQTAWLELKVNGRPRLPELICDGILISTAAGSTAYARAMGATPLLADTAAWLVVGSNVIQPPLWKSALLTMDAEVAISNRDPEKRPIQAYADGQPQGLVQSMRARVSRIASVQLAFLPGRDMAEKIAAIQFPG